MIWMPVVKSVAELIEHVAFSGVGIGLLIAVIRDSLPTQSFEGKLMHGSLVVSGLAIVIGFIAGHVK